MTAATIEEKRGNDDDQTKKAVFSIPIYYIYLLIHFFFLAFLLSLLTLNEMNKVLFCFIISNSFM